MIASRYIDQNGWKLRKDIDVGYRPHRVYETPTGDLVLGCKTKHESGHCSVNAAAFRKFAKLDKARFIAVKNTTSNKEALIRIQDFAEDRTIEGFSNEEEFWIVEFTEDETACSQENLAAEILQILSRHPKLLPAMVLAPFIKKGSNTCQVDTLSRQLRPGQCLVILPGQEYHLL